MFHELNYFVLLGYAAASALIGLLVAYFARGRMPFSATVNPFWFTLCGMVGGLVGGLGWILIQSVAVAYDNNVSIGDRYNNHEFSLVLALASAVYVLGWYCALRHEPSATIAAWWAGGEPAERHRHGHH